MSSSLTVTPARKGSAEKAIPHTRIQDDGMIADHYEVGNKIGQGNFGKVYEATHRTTGIKWAIKSINKEKAGSSALKLVEREVAILKRVNHPNIINLNEVIESPKRMYLVMELCQNGELAEVLKEVKMFSEAKTKKIMERLASAISYLHKHGIVHRDLKLENILMGENPDDVDDRLHIKVTDFGLSVVKGGVTPDNMMQDFCGTPIYMAPEILDNKAYSQQCDVWALGIIMYTLVCGYPPFRAKEETALYDLIREAKVEFDDIVWSSASDECKNCILGMLKLDPAHRLSAAEVLNHPWITGQERDTTQPTNVLEMMKMWKDELKLDQDGNTSVSASDSVDASGTCTMEGIPEDKEPAVKKDTISPSLGVPSTSTKSAVQVATKKNLLMAPKSHTRSLTPTSATTYKVTAGNGVSKSPIPSSSRSNASSSVAIAKAKKK